MQKVIIIAIIALVVIVVALGAYLMLSNGNNGAIPTENQTASQNSNFEIQGMKVQVLAQGSGSAAKTNDSVTVNYVGTLADGTKFDSSVDRNAPFTFPIGQERVIKGWDLGVVGMKVGEKRKLIIPPDLAYGPNGFPPVIPQNATLTFEVELLKIN